MLEGWTHVSLAVFDFLLGWLLALPSDVVLLAVAIGSAAILTLVRLVTTDQDLLGRAARDRRRLRVLIKEAARRGDGEAVRRMQATRPKIALRTLRCEGLPLALAILPIAMLATWCFARLEFHPPRADEPIRIIAYTPVSAAGQVMHLVPQDGLRADAWVRPVAAVTDQGPPHGIATWTVRGATADRPYRLTFRLKGRSLEHDLAIGGRTYAAPVVGHGEPWVTEMKMLPVRLFGVVPGMAALGLAPWLVAYLVIVIPSVSLLKRLLRIY